VGGGRTFLFRHNFKPSPQSLDLGAARLRDLSDGRLLTGPLTLPAHGSLVGEPA